MKQFLAALSATAVLHVELGLGVHIGDVDGGNVDPTSMSILSEVTNAVAEDLAAIVDDRSGVFHGADPLGGLPELKPSYIKSPHDNQVLLEEKLDTAPAQEHMARHDHARVWEIAFEEAKDQNEDGLEGAQQALELAFEEVKDQNDDEDDPETNPPVMPNPSRPCKSTLFNDGEPDPVKQQCIQALVAPALTATVSAVAKASAPPPLPSGPQCDVDASVQKAAAEARQQGKTDLEVDEVVRNAARLCVAKTPELSSKPEEALKAIEDATTRAKDAEDLEDWSRKADENRQEIKLETVAAKAKVARARKEVEIKDSQEKQAEVAVEAEAVKEKAAELSIKLQKAKAEVANTCKQLGGLEAAEKKAIAEVDRKKTEMKGQCTKEAMRKKAKDQIVFDKATKVAARRVLAARKAAEMASIAAGRSPAEAELAGKKAQAAQAKALAVQASAVKLNKGERKKCQDSDIFHQSDAQRDSCTGWAPTDGPMAGKGMTCQTWGWTRKWCWVNEDYRGPGHEWIQISNLYPGKNYAPCSSKGTFDKYTAAWAKTGCPSTPDANFFVWHRQQEDKVAFERMYSQCMSKDPQQVAACCGPSVSCEVGCNPTCRNQAHVPQENGLMDGNSTSNGTHSGGTHSGDKSDSLGKTVNNTKGSDGSTKTLGQSIGLV
jgi:hypothetical protein